MSSRLSVSASLLSLILVVIGCVAAGDSECHNTPKILCCEDKILEKCLIGCLNYAKEKCPEKLEKFDTIEDEPLDDSPAPSKKVSLAKETRRAPQKGDYNLLNKEYPITEVSDNDLTSECGTEKSRPPFSPCLSRKTVDDVFLSCCQQHVPSNCHSLCTYEHREQAAAETLIHAVQQEGCDLKYLSSILYCANQNRDNTKCCEHLGMANGDLGVGDRCLRMCNIGQSGNRINSVEKNDLVCLSNWNVLMYCARSGMRTIN